MLSGLIHHPNFWFPSPSLETSHHSQAGAWERGVKPLLHYLGLTIKRPVSIFEMGHAILFYFIIIYLPEL